MQQFDEVQQQDFSAPQHPVLQQPELNKPACAAPPNPKVATTAVNVFNQFIRAASPSLGTNWGCHVQLMVPSYLIRRFADTEEKSETARDARRKFPSGSVTTNLRDLSQTHRHRVRAIVLRTGFVPVVFRGPCRFGLTNGNGRSGRVNRQPRNPPMNFSTS